MPDQTRFSELSVAEKCAIERLCRATGHSSPHDAIVARAQALLAEHGQLDTPFEPEKMACLQRITRVDRTDITFDACLLPTSEGFRVEVCKYHPRGRQTFSIAHEIGHTFLIEFEPTLGEARRETGISSSANSNLVEKLCDRAATELIWPTHTFQRDVWQTGPSLNAVLKLASKYKASVTATARRFAEIGLWRCAFVIWERECTTENQTTMRPRVISKSECAPFIRSDQITTPEDSGLYVVWHSDQIIRGKDIFSAGGRRFYSESIKLGSSVLSMIIFEPYAEILAAKEPQREQQTLFRT